MCTKSFDFHFIIKKLCVLCKNVKLILHQCLKKIAQQKTFNYVKLSQKQLGMLKKFKMCWELKEKQFYMVNLYL